MAMNHGQFIAVYTEKYVGKLELWHSTYVPPTGERLLVNPLPVDLLSVDDPLYEWATKNDPHFIEYGRYEPQYDEQFFQMCNQTNASRRGALVVPSVTADKEAMRLLHIVYSLSGPLNERYFDLHDKRKKSLLRLRDLLKPIRLRHGWTYLLGYVGKGSTNIFLTDDPMGEALIEELNADKFEHRVIEKW
jgi:hypothetical protein